MGECLPQRIPECHAILGIVAIEDGDSLVTVFEGELGQRRPLETVRRRGAEVIAP